MMMVRLENFIYIFKINYLFIYIYKYIYLILTYDSPNLWKIYNVHVTLIRDI